MSLNFFLKMFGWPMNQIPNGYANGNHSIYFFSPMPGSNGDVDESPEDELMDLLSCHRSETWPFSRHCFTTFQLNEGATLYPFHFRLYSPLSKIKHIIKPKMKR